MMKEHNKLAIQIEAYNSGLTKEQTEFTQNILLDGGVIIYPTDTIYGIGCDITNTDAIGRGLEIKGRDANKPMSFVCADLRHIKNYAHVSEKQEKLIENSFRGLTLLSYRLPAKHLKNCSPNRKP